MSVEVEGIRDKGDIYLRADHLWQWLTRASEEAGDPRVAHILRRIRDSIGKLEKDMQEKLR